MESNQRISVVVPVYNAGKYLARCLDSICEQTYQNLEIILVDDGSTDHSLELEKQYQQHDNRIRVIAQKNSGPAVARNTGLDAVSGKYVVFIDSDDYVTTEYIERLYRLQQEYQADIACCLMQKTFAEDRVYQEKDSNPTIKMYSGEEALQRLLYRKNDMYASSCLKLYKTELLQGIRFPTKDIYAEDMSVVYRALAKSRSVVVMQEAMYYYFQRGNSIMHSFDERKMRVLNIVDEIYEFVQYSFPALIPAADSRMFVSSVQMLKNMPYKTEYRSYRKNLYKRIRSTRHQVAFDNRNKISTRCMAFLAYIHPEILGVMGKVYSVVIMRANITTRY